MEIPRIAHDEYLHRVEEAREEQLLKELQEIGHGARYVDDDEAVNMPAHPHASEKTPLLLAGRHLVALEADVDIKALALKLNADEHAAVLADAKMPAKEIISYETTQLIKMSLPLMLAVMLEILPEILLSMMAGNTDPARSTEILAAFSLVSLFQMLLVAGLMNGLGSAIDTRCSQAFGGKRLREMWMFTQAGLLVFVACMPFVSLALLNGGWILKQLGQDPAIADLASYLLVISLLSLPFTILYSVLKSSLQAQNIVAPFAMSSFVSWLVSLPIAYVLGFHTSLGFLGIAVSNVINNAVKSLALVPVVLRNEAYVNAWPGWQLRDAARLLPKISRLAISSVLMVTFQMVGFSFISLLSGLLPNAAVMIAANSIFTSVIALSFMPLLGMCIAGAIRIGNALGAGQARRASLIGRVVLASCFGVSTFAMAMVVLVADPFAHSFTSDDDAVDTAIEMIHRLVAIVPLLGFMFGVQSIYRACGKQWFCAVLNFLFMFALSVPLGLFIAIKLDEGISGLWYGQLIGMALFVLTSCIWLNSMSWDKMAHEARMSTHLHVEEPEASASEGSAAEA